MIAVQFKFIPGTYDESFFALDNSIEEFVGSLPGYLGVEKWQSADGKTLNPIYYFEDREVLKVFSKFDDHITAKKNYKKWYDAYQVIVSEVVASYGDRKIPSVVGYFREPK